MRTALCQLQHALLVGSCILAVSVCDLVMPELASITNQAGDAAETLRAKQRHAAGKTAVSASAIFVSARTSGAPAFRRIREQTRDEEQVGAEREAERAQSEAEAEEERRDGATACCGSA
jgi:hypothetical protein